MEADEDPIQNTCRKVNKSDNLGYLILDARAILI
jgi:hypothetical protein